MTTAVIEMAEGESCLLSYTRRPPRRTCPTPCQSSSAVLCPTFATVLNPSIAESCQFSLLLCFLNRNEFHNFDSKNMNFYNLLLKFREIED